MYLRQHKSSLPLVLLLPANTSCPWTATYSSSNRRVRRSDSLPNKHKVAYTNGVQLPAHAAIAKAHELAGLDSLTADKKIKTLLKCITCEKKMRIKQAATSTLVTFVRLCTSTTRPRN